MHRESIAASLYDINHWNRGKDLIVPKAIGFLTNNFISSKYRREKVEKRLSSGYPGWSKKEGRGEKLFQFSFKRVCTSILCALTVVQYIFIPDIIAIIMLQEKKKKESLVSLFEKSDIRPKNVIIHIIILNVVNLTYYI